METAEIYIVYKPTSESEKADIFNGKLHHAEKFVQSISRWIETRNDSRSFYEKIRSNQGSRIALQ